MMKNKTVWWYDYRKRLYRPRAKNMSFEFILRRVTRKTFKEYAMNCSLAGVTKIFDPNSGYKERLVRMAMFCVMFGSIFYFLQYLWFDNLAKPLIVTMESNTYPISNIEFPAITFCNFNRISKKALQKYVKKNYRKLAPNNESIEQVEWFCKQLGRLLDYSYNKSVQVHPILFSFVKHLGDSHNIINLMKELSPPCEDLLIRCSWSGDIIDCKKIFSVHRTVRGHCCTFNVVLSLDATGSFDNSIYTVKRQHEPGQLNGLNVVLDTMVDDYTYTLYNMIGYEVLIFDPTHFADPTGGRVTQRIAQPDQAVFFEIHSIKQIATDEVRKYPETARKCLFRDERKDQFNELYSYSSCIVKCRIRTIQSLCKCTPYFFPTRRSVHPICTLDDIRCLNKYREKLLYLYPKDAVTTDGLEAEIQDALNCDECLPDCELTQHFTKQSKIPLSFLANKNKEFTNYFLDDINMTSKTLVCIYQGTTNSILNRLDIIYYWFELVSNVGGFCGILVGFSLISILEFIYFLIFRFSYNMYYFAGKPTQPETLPPLPHIILGKRYLVCLLFECTMRNK
ncbi:sodium channel protein Nach-like [Vanessa cardui]|uniref:sodium channel protein Nach-like n=1 Tax=Vanessa cardui TaxID=171605 RepID=UPI001F132264|nr:sodium channel protein Nach-like [Vanessa cardui]